MCWVGRKLLERIPRIAWKNFVVYKVMTTDAKSPSEDYEYIFNKEMPKIKKGYHSFSSKVYFANYLSSVDYKEKNVILATVKHENIILHTLNKNEQIHYGIIPKWSKYYINEYGEIVSEKIVITDKIAQYGEE